MHYVARRPSVRSLASRVRAPAILLLVAVALAGACGSTDPPTRAEKSPTTDAGAVDASGTDLDAEGVPPTSRTFPDGCPTNTDPGCTGHVQPGVPGTTCAFVGSSCTYITGAGSNPCNGGPHVMTCCDAGIDAGGKALGFWWEGGTCPEVESEPACPGPVVARSCGREGLICERAYGHIRCCDGAWQLVAEDDTDDDDGGGTTCTSPRLPIDPPRSCGDVELSCDGEATCQDGAYVLTTFGEGLLPQGSGGAIVPGDYVLRALNVHELKDCSPKENRVFAQTLQLRGGDGWLAHTALYPDQAKWHLSFSYEAQGPAIAFSPTCTLAPFSMLIEYKTFTASEETLELFSARCGYRARFHRIRD